MKFKSVGRFIAAASLLAMFAGFGYGLGSQQGHNQGFDDSRRVNDVAGYPVPANYTSALTPVPYQENASFAFDTFVFVDEKGRKMAVPVPASR
ncbi:hypothetical protein FYK55_28745 [Roseiconus nitratireducens]|uniref:Uncharacterized protein n=1 Tax=Roseiconus nitratireducens TaxID=2605748 RepID=A0A5M6CCQ5_9BACT|nr:hypothetical protein [Roseiconus nitratireducens]KAA5532958.1 hypothetical protein FYK55_28745 [Roseiconus nitratireducens]